MCKYCKRLKELKDLDTKEYKKIISMWRERDKKSCDLLFDCVRLFHALPVPYNVYHDIEHKILSFLEVDYLGK